MDMHEPNHALIAQTLVGISFDNEFRAQEFLVVANGLAAAGKLKLNDAVTVVNDAGTTIVRETVDRQTGALGTVRRGVRDAFAHHVLETPTSR